jgi:hypothetical protein
MNRMGQVKRLQRALSQKGILYKINTNQFYSAEQQRFITSYRVTEKRIVEKPDGRIAAKDVELLKTCSVPELVKWFAGQWEKSNEERFE